jgi:hypothetical protein
VILRRPPATVIVAFVALVAAGCGGDGEADGQADGAGPAPTSAPLTSEQASRLADILFDNLDVGGARFTISARTADGETMAITGEVDWVSHTGRADVVATGPEEDLREVVWTEDVILERRPALLEDLAFDYVARAPAPATRTIDRLVAVVAALAGEQRDNPLLIQQTPGSASFGSQTLGGRDVEVLRYGDENRYWLDTETGALVRFEQPPSPDRDAFVLDLTERGPQTVSLPPVDTTIPATDLGDLYPFA